MENPFSFLKEEALPQEQRSTRRRTLRQMKYSTAYQTNIISCAKAVCKKDYVGKLGAAWTFPSDHLPIGALIIPRMIQESVHSEAGATKFDQAKPIAEEGPVLHRPDKARSNSGDAGTGRNRFLNHERYIRL